MHITLSENAVSPQKSPLQKRFEKLWREVKNQQRANAKLKNELAELHKTYHEIILPVEQLTEKPYTQLAQRLIVFFSRKSLTQWQRQELGQWILECIEHIEPINPLKSHELTTAYHQALGDFLAIEVDAIEEAMNNQFGDSLSNMNVAAGASIPFTIVFRNLPEGIANINVEVVDSKPGAG